MDIQERIKRAIERITTGHGCMRVPAEATDPDLVLADCQQEISRLRALLHDAQRDAERFRFFCAAFNHQAQREWLARGFKQPHGEFNKSWDEIIDAAMAAEREGRQ